MNGDMPTETLARTILRMVEERGPDRTVCPSEVARALAGGDERRWRLLMKPIRAEAVRLALGGEISIRRKGRIVDPADFKGIYRLGAPPDGPGNSEVVRPDSR